MQNDIKPPVPVKETPIAAAAPPVSEPQSQPPLPEQPADQAPAVETPVPVPDTLTTPKKPKKSTTPIFPILIAIIVFLGLSACAYAIYRGL